MSIAVLIGTYGEQKWADLAMSRAYPSAQSQLAVNDVIEHRHDPDGDVASVRNHLGRNREQDWLCFLDADDELAPGFLEAMRRTIAATTFFGEPTLFTPRVQYVHKGRADPPKFWPVQDLRLGNWLIIGTLVPRVTFLEVGGFDRRRHGYEDWELWLKIDKLGCRVRKVHDATYIAHVDPKSRNRHASKRERVFWHYEIGHEHYPDIYDEAWLARHLGNMGRRG